MLITDIGSPFLIVAYRWQMSGARSRARAAPRLCASAAGLPTVLRILRPSVPPDFAFFAPFAFSRQKNFAFSLPFALPLESGYSDRSHPAICLRTG